MAGPLAASPSVGRSERVPQPASSFFPSLSLQSRDRVNRFPAPIILPCSRGVRRAGDFSSNLVRIYFDEKGKIPLARRGCLLIITGSAFGGSSVPQNLGSGQRIEPTPRSWGSMGGHRSRGKMKGKLGGGPGRVWSITMTHNGVAHCVAGSRRL
jgi:hypothetical protein